MSYIKHYDIFKGIVNSF